jgi:hypothetical protein
MLTVASLFWTANRHSQAFSTMYDETWVEKLYRGFFRNLTEPFRFVLYTDRERVYSEPVEQVVQPDLGQGGYGDCIRPYALGEPMILVGLDTVVTGNCDHLAKYCLEQEVLALPRDPYRPQIACNGVALVPRDHEEIGITHRGENDMEWCRSFHHTFIDDLWPGHVVSFKGHVKKHGLGDARIVYMHGQEKAHQLQGADWVAEHWR